MADIIVDGMTKVSYVPTIANIAAPTVAELNAGTALQSTLIPAGPGGLRERDRRGGQHRRWRRRSTRSFRGASRSPAPVWC